MSNWNRRLWNKLKSPMQAQSKIHWKVNPKEGIKGNLASGLLLKSYWPPTHHPTNPPIYLIRTRLVTRPWWFSSSTSDSGGWTALHQAAIGGQTPVVTGQPPPGHLLAPLTRTAAEVSPGQPRMVKCLLLWGADIETLTNNKEDTQLHWASI